MDYASKEEADAASNALAGLTINGRSAKVDNIGVKVDKPVGERAPRERSSSTRGEGNPSMRAQHSVFLGNLDFTVSEQDIAQLIETEIGSDKIIAVRVNKDRETGRSKGFAHVDCVDAQAASSIVSALNGFTFADRQLKADFADRGGNKPSSRGNERREFAPRDRSPSAPSSSVFIANLAWDVTPELVEEMVNDVVGPGVFQRVRLATDRETGKLRGFGHIDLVNVEAAERAVKELDGMEVLGRQIRADFATAPQERSGGGGGRRGGGRGDSRGEDNAW